MAKDIFLSYKSEDYAEAEWIKGVLEHNGISCWMAPACIPGGSNYASEIPKAIRECRVFVLVLSKKAQESKWVPKEVDQAINEGKTIMPFMLENFELRDDFNFYLSNIQRYTAYENKVLAAEKMLREIRAMLNIEAPKTAPQQPPQNSSAQTAYQNPPIAPNAANTNQKTPAPSEYKQGGKFALLGAASIVLAVICLICVFSVISFLFALAGLVCVVMWSKKAPACDRVGKIVSIVGLVLNIIMIVASMGVAFYGTGAILGLVLGGVSIWLFVRGRLKAK
ncbi:MAG: TIR domain-containing protein [Clostridia bacterium]|nr:TIR domain-containing protein [Clostridia bacterium]